MIDLFKKRIEHHKNSQSTNYLSLTSGSFDFLRSDPRFEEILEEMKKLYDELLEKYPDIEL